MTYARDVAENLSAPVGPDDASSFRTAADDRSTVARVLRPEAVYEPGVTHFIESRLTLGMVVVDVVAHVARIAYDGAPGGQNR